jgi:hypothetical protein
MIYCIATVRIHRSECRRAYTQCQSCARSISQPRVKRRPNTEQPRQARLKTGRLKACPRCK